MFGEETIRQGIEMTLSFCTTLWVEITSIDKYPDAATILRHDQYYCQAGQGRRNSN
jgi:hypothetical protein